MRNGKWGMGNERLKAWRLAGERAAVGFRQGCFGKRMGRRMECGNKANGMQKRSE